MSLEQQIARLADAVEKNNTLLAGGVPTTTSAPQKTEQTTTHEDPDTDESNEIIWYHAPDDKKVWSEEGPAKRRKGVVRLEESTAKKIQAKYAKEAEEAEKAAAAGQSDDGLDGDFDMDLGGDGDAPKFDESEDMDKETFGGHWNDWTKEAIKHALDTGADDKAAAQTEVKKFIVPVVKAFVGKGEEPKVANIPDDLRAKFLNKAQDFFNG